MKFVPMSQLSASDAARYEDLPVHNFSYDDGYYAKKIVSPFVEQGTSLRTLMGTTTKRMSTSGMFLDIDDIPGVEIIDGTMRYLFGLHADDQLALNSLVSKSGDDVSSGNVKLQQFFAAALRRAFPKPGRYNLQGMVLMPVVAFQNDPEFKQHVRDALVGLHTFKAFTSFNDGAPVYEDYEFFVKRILIIEQPMGSLFRVALDPANDVDVKQFVGKHGLKLTTTFLDWGAGTLDIFTVKNMKERVDRMCGSTNAGISVLYDTVRNVLPAGLTPTPMQLEAAIMAGRFIDNRTGEIIDLKAAIQEGADNMWNLSMQLFDETIGSKAPDVSHIFVTGGSSGWMQPYVLEWFGAHRVFKAMDNPTIDPDLPYEHLMSSSNLHMRNAMGGYLYIKDKK